MNEENNNPAAPLPTDGKSLPGNIVGAAEELVNHPGKVFSGIPKLLTGHNAYDRGRVKEAYKLLLPEAIKSESAMPGLEPGAVQIHIAGTAVTHVDTDLHLFIQGKRNETTMLDAEFAYHSVRLTEVLGDDEQLNWNESNQFVMGETSLQYVGKREISAPEDFEWKQFERGFSATKMEVNGLETAFTVAKIEFTGVDYSLKGIDAGPENGLLEMFKSKKWNFNKWSEEAAEKAEEEAKAAAEKAAEEAKVLAEKAAEQAKVLAEKATAEAEELAAKTAAEAPGLLEEAGAEIAAGADAAVVAVEGASVLEVVEVIGVIALSPVGL